MKLFKGDGKIDWRLVGAFREKETACEVSKMLQDEGIRAKAEKNEVYAAASRAPQAVATIEGYMTQTKMMEQKATPYVEEGAKQTEDLFKELMNGQLSTAASTVEKAEHKDEVKLEKVLEKAKEEGKQEALKDLK